MTLIKRLRLALAVLAGALAATQAASLQKVTEDFGPNPRNVGFYIYVPDALAPRPPSSHAGSQYAALASRYGFIVIYPDSPNAADKCWDVSSNATLTHDRGGDSLGIASMVRWTLAKYGGDRDRVFVTGVSSGAMMTNVLVGAYPDLFAAGSAFAGVPFGCFAGEGYGTWRDACAKGKITHTGAEWAEMVRAAYPGYDGDGDDGWRPKMQVFHGTADEVLDYVNFGEEVKQWTSVLGLDGAPVSTADNTPVPGWTKYVYGSAGWFEAYSAAGVSHNIQNQEAVVMEWFDLACTAGDCFKWGRGSPRRRSG
ncbi:acetylxylan esterase-like protein 1 precursor [Apiospora marii]|uniref:Acetylxylan esterase-like protein 1 n=1 Tax=Apiospora marii TaxID=335849 RepID=A0ABR1RWP0_9PEZI